MQKIFKHKLTALLMGILGILAVGALAAGMRNITFRAPEPFSFNLALGNIFGSFQTLPNGNTVPLWQILLFWLATLYIFVLVFLLMDPANRKRVLILILRLTILMVMLYFAVEYTKASIIAQLAGAAGGPGALPTPSAAIAEPVFTPPENNTALTYLISAGITLAIVLLVWWLYRHNRRPQSATLREELAGIARRAASEIAGGQDWGDTITRCYLEMTAAVSAARGLSRADAMTPSEFARQLQKSGLPADPISRLTRLFEAVRYGGKTSSAKEQQEAIFCLNAIVAACEEGK